MDNLRFEQLVENVKSGALPGIENGSFTGLQISQLEKALAIRKDEMDKYLTEIRPSDENAAPAPEEVKPEEETKEA